MICFFFLIIVCVIILFENNVSFSILFGPFILFYYRVVRNRNKNRKELMESIASNEGGGNLKDIIATPSLYICYATGFVRYYDYRVSHIPSHHIRNWIYRNLYLMKLHKSATIYYGAQIRKPFNIKIGKGTTIGDNAILDGRNGIEIGCNVNLSSNVSIWTEQHDHRDPWFRCETQKKEKVVIGDRAWLGPNTIILHDVKIGEGAVVAAGAVVTKDVGDYQIVGGIPAKVIGERNHNLLYDNSKGIYNPFL